MARPDSDVLPELLTAARRKYDRKYNRLEAIDDKSMRTARTVVIVLGFVASAVAVSGPDAVGSLNPIALLTGGLGVLSLLVAGIVSVGIYAETIVPEDVTKNLITPGGGETDTEVWTFRAVITVSQAIDELDREIDRNRGYLQYASLLLLIGIIFLTVSSLSLITVRGFDLSIWVAPGIAAAVSVGSILVLRLMRSE
ncbi:hypothetical protein [Halosegnis longus]|uniref:hypothetical protein n=1 Tax=Halosegnis longus TaxID=2216012 RepID=UPI00129E3E65|nr:hypothetical protein [Halosegnis longus]